MTTVSGSRGASTGFLGAPTTAPTATDMGPEAFMRLLVTQIRNQDPLQPMDTRDMMAQLTQLTEVERLVAIDGRLASLQIATAAVANAQASDLVGAVVEADTSHLDLDEVGSARGALELEGAAASVRVEIRDAEGQLVRTLELGARGSGPCSFEWDGRDEAGNRMEPGRYSIVVSARDADGHPVACRTRVRGPVRAVRYDGGYPALRIGDRDVMMGDVRSVEEAERDARVGAPDTTAR